MASRARSHNACWTCRLRKKKCDERMPSCLLCRSLLLPCYGYGPRPEWMDGGENEKKTATEIRHLVKKETCRKQKLRMEAKKHTQKPPERINVPLDKTDLPNSLQAHLNQWIDRGTGTSVGSLSNPSASTRIKMEEEEGLVMHYLDYVFPLQFRFYQPSSSEGGRGWLLSIILRTKPLYYAVVTLSAFHRQLSSCTGVERTDTPCDMDRLLSCYAAAIKELRYFIAGFETRNLPETLPELVEILACTVILISLELFNGNDGDNWQVHLKAAKSLIPILQKDSIICTYPDLSPVYKSALYFFGGVLAWYDILSFATTKTRPSTLYPCVGPGTGYKGCIQLEKVMGCENWAALTILDIAILSERKEMLAREGNLAMSDLEARGAEIARRLEEGIAKNAIEKCETRDIQYTTNIFACSALIYLLVVVSGARPELDSMRDAVRRTVDAIQMLPGGQLLRYLVWPICITACMATEEHHDFFGRMPIPEYGMLSRAMEVIRESWRLRKSGASEDGLVDWSAAMNSLGLHVLLV